MSVIVYTIQTGRPWLAAERFLSHIKTCKSGATWATVDRLNGRRFKVGATAFLTVEAADMRRAGLCAKNLQPGFVDCMERRGLECVVDASARARPPHVYRRQIAP